MTRRIGTFAAVPAGILTGALAWALGASLSGTFEPFDSWTGFATTQVVLCGSAFVTGFSGGGKSLALLLAGGYIGLNLYAWVFGGSEARVWFVIGAVSTLTLIVLPLVTGLLGVGLRRARTRRVTHPVE